MEQELEIETTRTNILQKLRQPVVFDDGNTTTNSSSSSRRRHGRCGLLSSPFGAVVASAFVLAALLLLVLPPRENLGGPFRALLGPDAGLEEAAVHVSSSGRDYYSFSGYARRYLRLSGGDGDEEEDEEDEGESQEEDGETPANGEDQDEQSAGEVDPSTAQEDEERLPTQNEEKDEPPILVNTYTESTTQKDYTFALQELTERLRTRPPTLNFSPNATRQFAHLHHMKTGGTSVNRLISCGLDRARKIHAEEEEAELAEKKLALEGTAEATEATETEATTEIEAKRDEGEEVDTEENTDATTTTEEGEGGDEHNHDGGRTRRQQRQRRQRASTSRTLPFTSLEECSSSRYQNCISGTSPSAESCRSSIDSAAVMQYCAPLHQVQRFDWLDADLVSVIRHPVDRVWSMFRFQTKGCFKCTPLLEIYKQIDDGTVGDDLGVRDSCVDQLLNHQTTNLLTDAWDGDAGDGDGVGGRSTDEEKVAEAVHNLQTRLALVGVTDQLPVFAEMLGKVFPWLAKDVDSGGADDGDNADGADGDGGEVRALLSAKARAATASAGSMTCELPHANASPKNNRCGPGSTHWDLPDHPDEETVRVILEHNQLDMKVYEAAKERFELEKRVLGL